eukprot:CAMPEP_0174834522 /NCGR_PEP_ID=MMETSP1114-20130205/4871_1 /TAXON_ID=312471 /ORGANISM="Neobodo designis, Strain CCAP 1951/1" /LENGTH=918 /DNA_ID=CAMNT_0016068433 /DNA_START=58 /DNA_END=2814 /DNA_ORIENTATION=+
MAHANNTGGYVYNHQHQGYGANEQLVYRQQPQGQYHQQQQPATYAAPPPQQQYQQQPPPQQQPTVPLQQGQQQQQPPPQQQQYQQQQARNEPRYSHDGAHDGRATSSTVMPSNLVQGSNEHTPKVPRQHAIAAVLGATFVVIMTFTALGVWLRANMFVYDDAYVAAKNAEDPDKPMWWFGKSNIVFLIIYWLFAPWFLGAPLVAANAVCSYASPGKTRRVPALILAFLSLVVGFVALALWAHRVVDCGVFWCLGTDTFPKPTPADNYKGDGFRTINGTMILFACIGFSLAMLRVAFAESVDGLARKMKCMYKDAQIGDWILVLFSLVMVVLMWLTTMYMPNDLAKAFTPWKIAATAAAPYECDHDRAYNPDVCPEMKNAVFRTTATRVNSSTVFRLFPANIFFYVYLMVMIVAGAIINATQAYRGYAQRRRFYIIGRYVYVTAANVAGWLATLAMLSLFAVYWFHDHNYRNSGDATKDTERAARSFGQLAVAFMSLQLFPIARTSVVHRVLGTSPEAFLYAHRVLGYGTLIAVICHIGLWFSHFRKLDKRITVLDIPPSVAYEGYTTSYDNYTLPVQTVLTFFMLIVMGFGTLPPVRRKAWELFKYSHMVAAYAIIPSTLLHAAASWQYMLPGLTVYIIDRLLRMSRSSRTVKSATATAVGDEYTRLDFTGGFMAHRAGQYAYINIPAISLLQWHPFTISSTPGDDVTQMHIKDMGPGTFTHALRKIAEAGAGEPVEIEMFVDGPVGATNLHLGDYDAICLVAGGVGITPCASIVGDLMRTGAVMDTMRGKGDKPAPRVSLLWVLKDGRALAESLNLPTSRNAEESDFALGLASLDVQAFETRPTTDRSAPWARSSVQGWDFQQGRPDVWASIGQAIPASAKRPLLFACGPASFVKDAVYAAQKQRPNVLVHTETFEM